MKSYNVDDYTETIKFAYLPIKVQGRWIWFTKYIHSYKYMNENDWNTNLKNVLYTKVNQNLYSLNVNY